MPLLPRLQGRRLPAAYVAPASNTQPLLLLAPSPDRLPSSSIPVCLLRAVPEPVLRPRPLPGHERAGGRGRRLPAQQQHQIRHARRSGAYVGDGLATRGSLAADPGRISPASTCARRTRRRGMARRSLAVCATRRGPWGWGRASTRRPSGSGPTAPYVSHDAATGSWDVMPVHGWVRESPVVAWCCCA